MNMEKPRRSRSRAAKFLALLGAIISLPALAENTNSQQISQFLYDGSADYAYFIGLGSWGTSCNATYVQITAGVPFKDKLFAAALAAYAAGKTVTFQGTCSTQTGYFNATYITVSG
jgi:hypothetical protein